MSHCSKLLQNEMIVLERGLFAGETDILDDCLEACFVDVGRPWGCTVPHTTSRDGAKDGGMRQASAENLLVDVKGELTLD